MNEVNGIVVDLRVRAKLRLVMSWKDPFFISNMLIPLPIDTFRYLKRIDALFNI